MTTLTPLIPLLVVFQTVLARECPERKTPWFQHNGGGKLCYAYDPDKGDAMPKGVYCWSKRNHSPRVAPKLRLNNPPYYANNPKTSKPRSNGGGDYYLWFNVIGADGYVISGGTPLQAMYTKRDCLTRGIPFTLEVASYFSY